MIVAVISKEDGHFALNHEGDLIPISEKQKEYYEVQLVHQQKPSKSLSDKCWDFLDALGKLGPLIIHSWSLHHAKNSLVKQELLDAQKNTYTAKQIYLNSENDKLNAENQRLANSIPDWNDYTPEYQEHLRDTHPSLYQGRLNDTKISYNQHKGATLELKKTQLDYEMQKANTEYGLEVAKLVLHLVQNAPTIVEAVKDVFVIGADIVYTIASNTWNWMVSPKAKPLDNTISHVAAISQIEDSQELAFNHDMDNQEFDPNNEMSIMGDLNMMGAAAAA